MASNESAVARLCQECGLCCDGSLFTVVGLEADEDCPVGPVVLDGKGDRKFLQPCRCFDKVCTIYEARPRACAVYFCHTAKLVDAGRLDLDRGLERIARMRGVVEQLRAMSGDREAPVSALVRKAVDAYRARRKTPQYSEADRALATAAFEYRKLKKRYFAPRYKRYLGRLRRALARLRSPRGAAGG